MPADPHLEIYYDGSCRFCRWCRETIEPWDTRGRLRFLDYNDPEIAAMTGLKREELGREMHLWEPEGLRTGYAAWTRILLVLPGLAWLGWLLAEPPLRWMGPGVYRWVAGHRNMLPGVPESCTPEGCPPPRHHG